MKTVDSDALGVVQKQLGISGVGGSQATEFEDGVLAQVFEVNSSVRRARAAIATDGWFYGAQRHVHAAAGDISTIINPYAPFSAAQSGFPLLAWPGAQNSGTLQVPRDYDVWLHHFSMQMVIGGTRADFERAYVELDVPSALQGQGVISTGGSLGVSGHIILGQWDDIVQTPVQELGINSLGGQTTYVPNIRVPRNSATIRFHSHKNNAGAMTLDMFFVLGLFPAGMGSDVAG